MEVSVRPGPEVAVTIAAVVALQAVAEHVAPDDPVIERYFTGKHGIGMRRAREANPAFAAQSHLEVRMILEVPGDLMATNVEAAATGTLSDPVLADFEMKGISTAHAQTEFRKRKALGKTLWLTRAREPRGPDLYRSASRIGHTSRASGIHQQIAKPPGAAAIRQCQTQKPHLVAPTHREPRVGFVEGCGFRKFWHANSGNSGTLCYRRQELL